MFIKLKVTCVVNSEWSETLSLIWWIFFTLIIITFTVDWVWNITWNRSCLFAADCFSPFSEPKWVYYSVKNKEQPATTPPPPPPPPKKEEEKEKRRRNNKSKLLCTRYRRPHRHERLPCRVPRSSASSISGHVVSLLVLRSGLSVHGVFLRHHRHAPLGLQNQGVLVWQCSRVTHKLMCTFLIVV